MPGKPMWRPTKGSARREREARSTRRQSHERREKAGTRRELGDRCVLVPWCTARAETAHLDDKGMGGDPQGIRTQANRMVRACVDHHQGPWSLHSGHLRVETLTPTGTFGHFLVWAREDRSTNDWYVLNEVNRPPNVEPRPRPITFELGTPLEIGE